MIKWLVEIVFLLQCPSPPSPLPGNVPMALHLLIGSPLTQAGLWMETRILIRPGSLLHHRQSWATYPLSLHQYSVSKQQNKSHSKQPRSTRSQNSFYLCQTYCWGSTDGSGVTSIDANDDKRASWWNFTMIVLRCENKRGVYVQRVYETWGETVITNEYTRLLVRSLPWKQFCEKAVMCPDCKWGENDWSSNSLLASGLWCGADILRRGKVEDGCGGNNKSTLS